MKYYFPIIIVLFFGIFCETSHAQLGRRFRQPTASRLPATPQTAAAAVSKPATPGAATIDQPPPAEPQGDFRALLIVVQKYPQGRGGNLPNAWAEMTLIERELKKLGYKEIVTVSDEKPASSPHFASGNNAIQSLAAMADRTKKDDTLMVVISSHGFLRDGQSYFRMADNTAVSIDNIYALLRRSPSNKKLLIAEACRNESDGGNFVTGMKEKYYAGGKRQKSELTRGLTVFHACHAGERSYTLQNLDPKAPQEEHSVFLHYLVKGLDEADYTVGGNNGDLTVSELYSYLENKVRNDVKKFLGKSQQPETFSYDPSFVIGRRPIINPFLKMRVPMDSHLEVSLDQLAESGNRAIRDAQTRLGLTFLESWAYMRKTSTLGIAVRAPILKDHADATVADYARGLLQSYWQRELTQISDRCFSLSIELRDDMKSRRFRADMYRSLGLFTDALKDYNHSGTDMNLYVLLDKIAYTEPPQGLDTLAVRQVEKPDGNGSLIWNDHSKPETQRREGQSDVPSVEELDAGFEKMMMRTVEIFIRMGDSESDSVKQMESYRSQMEESWRKMTLEEKAEMLKQSEKRFAEMQKNFDRGTVYQGSDKSGAETTAEFEKRFAQGNLEACLERIAAEKNITLPQPDEPEEAGSSADSPRVCRLIVQELRGRGRQATWIRATVCDLGVEFDVWLKAQDVFWSKNLAENYWVAVGEHSPQYRNSQAVLQAKVQRVHNWINAYETVSTIMSQIPYAPSLPAVGAALGDLEELIRAIYHRRVNTRMDEARGMIRRDYYRQWWNTTLDVETKAFNEKYGDK